MEVEGGRTIDTFLHYAIERTAKKMGVDASIVLHDGTPESRLYDAMVQAEVVKPR